MNTDYRKGDVFISDTKSPGRIEIMSISPQSYYCKTSEGPKEYSIRTFENIVQDNYKIENLAPMYVIRSTPNGVELKEVLVDYVYETELLLSFVKTKTMVYKLRESPYNIQIPNDKEYSVEIGTATGTGDLWRWSYYCTPNKDVADRLFREETERIENEYLKPNASVFRMIKNNLEAMHLPLMPDHIPVFTTLVGALNDFISASMDQDGRPATVDEVKSLFVKYMLYYKYSDKIYQNNKIFIG